MKTAPTPPATLPQEQTLTHWPPIVHIVEHRSDQPIRPGMRALCGARIMGVALPASPVTCMRCRELE